MIDINLLPPEYEPKKFVTLTNLAIFGAFSFIIISLLLSSLRLLNATQGYSERVDYHNQQIELYQQQVEDIRELRGQVKMLKTRLSLVEELLQEKTRWSDKLIELCQCLPGDGVWINSLTIGRGKAAQRQRKGAQGDVVEAVPITVYISGSVVSVDKLGQFVANLEESSTFGNVVFDSAKGDSTRPGSDSFKSFVLTVEVLAPVVEQG